MASNIRTSSSGHKGRPQALIIRRCSIVIRLLPMLMLLAILLPGFSTPHAQAGILDALNKVAEELDEAGRSLERAVLGDKERPKHKKSSKVSISSAPEPPLTQEENSNQNVGPVEDDLSGDNSMTGGDEQEETPLE